MLLLQKIGFLSTAMRSTEAFLGLAGGYRGQEGLAEKCTREARMAKKTIKKRNYKNDISGEVEKE